MSKALEKSIKIKIDTVRCQNYSLLPLRLILQNYNFFLDENQTDVLTEGCLLEHVERFGKKSNFSKTFDIDDKLLTGPKSSGLFAKLFFATGTIFSTFHFKG